MENILLFLSEAFSRAPDKVLRYRSLVLTGLAVITALNGWAIATRNAVDMTVEGFLPDGDPAMAALDEYRRQFGSDDSVFLVYRAKDGDVFSRESLQAIQELSNDLRYWQELDPGDYPARINGIDVDFSQLNHIRRVQSIATLRYQQNAGDTLLSHRLVPAELPPSATGLTRIKTRALAQNDYLLAFYSADARYGAILIQTDFGAQPIADYVPPVDGSEVRLDDSFGAFADVDGGGSFRPEFDSSAEVAEVTFEPVDMLGYASFHIATAALFTRYSDQFEFYPVGNPPMMEFMTGMLDQMQVLGMLMVLIFALLLYILFRSFSAVVWPLVTIAASVVWIWGATLWLGFPISSMISLTVLLVFAVGIADCVHVMSAYFSFRRQGLDHYRGLSLAYGKTGLAIMVTTVTTMAGVLALTGSELVPIRVFGFMSAAGVLLAFFFTLVLLPILLDLWHPGSAGTGDASVADRLGRRWSAAHPRYRVLVALLFLTLVYAVLGPRVGSYIALISGLTYVVVNWQREILCRVPLLVERRPWLILLLFGCGFLLCAYGTTRIRIDSNMTELTREGSRIRVAYETVDEHMAGAMTMVIMVDTKQTDGLYNPRLLQAMDALQSRIESRYREHVTRSHSLANVVKDTYQVMHDGDPAYYRVPDDRQLIAQLLYLFNSANPEQRRALVSDDYSRSHISLNIYNAGSHQYRQFFDDMALDIAAVFDPLQAELPELEAYLTGTLALLMRMDNEIAHSQFSSFSMALGVISAIMVLTLGSVQGGLMAMVPNLLPALLSFGLMGLLDVPLDTDTLLIAPVVIGIAVDDTIHFMTHYRMELIKTGSISDALESTIRDVGQAVLFTTMVLGLGFALLSFSDYLGMAKLGFFGSAAIFVALLCDLLLIPAMIMVFKPTFGVKGADTRLRFQGKMA